MTTTSEGTVGRGRPRAIIVGSGFGGLGAAVALQETGSGDLVILERADAVGGTWRDNTYPGAACDIPAHLYSFSFALKPDWSTHYPRQPEIRDYLERVTDRYGLRDRIRFGAEVVEARFDEPAACWQVRTRDGRRFEGEVLIAAPGPLSDPRIPDLPGRDDFAGAQFHSARWDHDVDLAGARVGVVGTGASAIQFVPHLVGTAAEVTIFQRSAPWIIPRHDREYPDWLKRLFARSPRLQATYRALIYLQKEVRFAGFAEDHPAMRLMQRFATWHMQRQVRDPALREKLRPDYAMGCKRILVSSDYYPALNDPSCDVVTDAIERITPAGVRLEGGREVDLDVLVWATGFRVADPLGPLEVLGLDGRRLSEEWQPYPYAHHGTTVPGFPNMFVVLGPNTGLGHNSMIYMMESQYRYIVDAVRRLADPHIAYLDVRDDAVQRFTGELRERNDDLVWSSGCRSWYVSEDGYNFSLWPGYTFEYRRRVRRLDGDDYRIVRRAA